MAARKKRAKKKRASRAKPPVYYQENGSVIHCAMCIKDDENVTPLRYPPVKVNISKPKKSVIETDGQKLFHYKFTWVNLCIPHAQEVILVLTEKEILL